MKTETEITLPACGQNLHRRWTQVRWALWCFFAYLPTFWLQNFPNGFARLQYNVFYWKRITKDANDSPVTRYTKQLFSDSQKGKETWHNLRSSYIREGRQSKKKIR